MSHVSQSLTPTRGRLMAVLITVAAAVVLLLSIQGSTARGEIQGTCEGGKFCVFTGAFYTGEELNFGCSAKFRYTGELYSAKNHCSVNVRIGWTEGGSTNWKACMGPGGERPEPGRFNTTEPNGC